MRYEIIQTRPYPDAAFEISRNGALIGGAARLPRKKRRDPPRYEVHFQNETYQLVCDTRLSLTRSLWGEPKDNPYWLYRSGEPCGELYHKFNHVMLLDGHTYTLRSVDFGAGLRIMIWEGPFRKERPTGKQLALIEAPSREESPPRRQVSALGEKEGLIAALMYVYRESVFYSRSTVYKITTEYTRSGLAQELALYDPDFRDQIED